MVNFDNTEKKVVAPVKNNIKNNDKIIKDILNSSILDSSSKTEEIVKQIEQEIASSLPLPTDEELTDKKQRAKYEKKLKDYTKKLKAGFWDNQVKTLVGLKADVQKEKQTNLQLVNKQFIYDRSRIERLREWWTKKTYIEIGLIDKTGAINYHSVRPENTNTVIVAGGEYLLDTTALLRKKGRPTFHYFKGVPSPITYDFEKHQPLVSSESLNTIWNSKIVNQLFNTGAGMNKTMLYTAGVIMTIGIVVVMIISVSGGTISQMFGGA